ncbi:hypothetical protein ACL1IT_09255 [Corynebacterium striatum]
MYQYSGSCWLTMTVEECSRLTRRLNTWAKAKADTSVVLSAGSWYRGYGSVVLPVSG